MERRPLTRRAALAVAAVVLLGAVGLAVVLPRLRGRRGTRMAAAPAVSASVRDDVRAPAGVRVKVEVLNATRVPGLARRATFYLRDRGFDVVESGNAPAPRDTTLVIDRSGHPDWARLVARAMDGAPVATTPDSSRYLDVTVLVGASWRPPPEPFYP